jgi:hypothetical protein
MFSRKLNSKPQVAQETLRRSNEELERLVGERTRKLEEAVVALRQSEQRLAADLTDRTQPEEALRGKQAELALMLMFCCQKN